MNGGNKHGAVYFFKKCLTCVQHMGLTLRLIFEDKWLDKAMGAKRVKGE